MVLDLSYPNVQKLVRPYLGAPRTESRAFLAWFLENVYRLESTGAADCICDGPDDKGVDGIYVEEEDNRIDILQAKISQSDTKTVGDTTLKDLVGTLAQFKSKSTTEALQESTGNSELRNVLVENNVAELIGQGWTVKGVLVTNSPMDSNALNYLSTTSATNLAIYDREAIRRAYISPDHIEPKAGPTSFDVFGYEVSEFNVEGAKVIVAPLSGTQLVELEGIESGELFDHNVRRSLGRTKINRDIERSVRDPNEHRHFMLYHNGLTVIADKVDTSIKDKITISNYIVVNGCQSLTVLWHNRPHVSDDLRVLGRLIELDRNSPLLDKITHNSNNQNGIKPRDFQSNSSIQLRLRTEFQNKYKHKIGYRISRGEDPQAEEIIDNEIAARVLLAFDLVQPWNCHQTFRLFDELHSDIFARPSVNATHIVSRVDALAVVDQEIERLEHELVRKYALTKYFLLYLMAQALRTDEIGKQFINRPGALLGDPISAEKRHYLQLALSQVLRDLMIDLNHEIKDREEEEYFDYKRMLKSRSEVRSLGRAVLASYEKVVQRGRAPCFGETWGEVSSSSGEETPVV